MTAILPVQKKPVIQTPSQVFNGLNKNDLLPKKEESLLDRFTATFVNPTRTTFNNTTLWATIGVAAALAANHLIFSQNKGSFLTPSTNLPSTDLAIRSHQASQGATLCGLPQTLLPSSIFSSPTALALYDPKIAGFPLSNNRDLTIDSHQASQGAILCGLPQTLLPSSIYPSPTALALYDPDNSRSSSIKYFVPKEESTSREFATHPLECAQTDLILGGLPKRATIVLTTFSTAMSLCAIANTFFLRRERLAHTSPSLSLKVFKEAISTAFRFFRNQFTRGAPANDSEQGSPS